MEFSNFNITVVGLGLIGGSFAMSLKGLFPKNLWGIDIDKSTIIKAEQMKIIDKGYTDPEIPLKDSDIVILAMYPSLTESFIKDNMSYFKQGAILTDVVGIKEHLVKTVTSHIRDDVDFIGGHPMTGKESKGLSFASKDLFQNTNYILTPTKNNKEENIVILENLIRRIGCKTIIRTTPKEHDEIIAYTSHLPHIIAVALLNSDILPLESSLFMAGSFKDVTRIADINCDLWLELFSSNSDNIVNTLLIFEEKIKEMKNAILQKNQVLIKAEFEKASLRRRELVQCP